MERGFSNSFKNSKEDNKAMSKKKFVVLMAFALILSLFLPNITLLAQQSNETFENPFIFSDVPDPDVIRVGDVYYMASTTMHMNPGVPIMKSYDLVNWEIVNYVYDILETDDEQSLRNGQSEYSAGSWAPSLRYHGGTYYAVFSSNTTGNTYVYTTDDIENGSWTRQTLDARFHDMSLLFDDDGRVYLVHGSGNISVTELTSDATAVKDGGLNEVIIPNSGEIAGSGGLPGEGATIQKINGKYYISIITWPEGGMRTQLIYRSDSINGDYEGRIVLQDSGIAQGGMIDTADGDWYAMIFQDNGAVGRTPFLVPVTWEDDWPIFGEDGQAPRELPVPVQGVKSTNRIVASDEFYQNLNRVFATNHSKETEEVLTKSESEMSVTTERIQLLENGNFENGIEPWEGFGANIELSSEEAYSGSSSLYVTNRQVTGDGPKQDITGKVEPGTVYEFSAKVKYTEGPDEKNFHFAIQNGATWEGIEVMGFTTAQKGEWVTIEGSYTLSEDIDLSETFIFIETPWTAEPDDDLDLMNFYVDDLSMTTTETVSEEANLIHNGSFEDGLEPWDVYGNATIEVTNEEAYSGSHSYM